MAQRLSVAWPATAADSMPPRRAGRVDWAHKCACDAVERARCLDALTSLCACAAVDEKRLLQQSVKAEEAVACRVRGLIAAECVPPEVP